MLMTGILISFYLSQASLSLTVWRVPEGWEEAARQQTDPLRPLALVRAGMMVSLEEPKSDAQQVQLPRMVLR